MQMLVSIPYQKFRTFSVTYLVSAAYRFSFLRSVSIAEIRSSALLFRVKYGYTNEEENGVLKLRKKNKSFPSNKTIVLIKVKI